MSILEKIAQIPSDTINFVTTDSPEASFLTVSFMLIGFLMFFAFAWIKSYLADYFLQTKGFFKDYGKVISGVVLTIIEFTLLYKMYSQMYLVALVLIFYAIALVFTFVIESEQGEKKTIKVVENGEVKEKKNNWKIYHYSKNREWAKTHTLYRFLAKYHLISGNRPEVEVKLSQQTA
ncbi:MAG TPA: hypothetical protein DCL21_04680 [Alphaproteobacteria bacterium]|nr:hypothetical protein [Alphaproteobacteria bacterium]